MTGVPAPKPPRPGRSPQAKPPAGANEISGGGVSGGVLGQQGTPAGPSSSSSSKVKSKPKDDSRPLKPHRKKSSTDHGDPASSSAGNVSKKRKKERKTKISRSTASRDRRNFHIHRLYVRQDFKDCMKTIWKQVKDYGERSEYAIYAKALIKRQLGRISDSLKLFQQCQAMDPNSVEYMKQVGRSLFLLGKFRAAIEIFEQAHRVGVDDWEVWHSKGVAFAQLGENEQAVECLRKANKISRHDITFMQLGKVYTSMGDLGAAVDVYQEALDFSPENPEILTTLGLLFLRMRSNYKAFEYLGNSLTIDASNPKTILGAGSIISDHGDYDVALVKYRIAAVHTPNSAQLWNNIAMCFYGQGNYLACIAALKKALYLSPFEWLICYNLGLAHLQTEQYASAFHFLSATINLKPDYGSAYSYLGVALGKMGDHKNARQAHDKAVSLSGETDHVVNLNQAIALANTGDTEAARKAYRKFKTIFDGLDNDAKNVDPGVTSTAANLAKKLKI